MDRQTKKTTGSDWIKKELSNLSLGDKRLNARLLEIAKNLSEHHQMPINQACEDWASTKAAYRFFANEKVSAEKVLRTHQDQTQNRLRKERVILNIQDTMYLNFTHHPDKQGLGPIGTNEQNLKGLVVHGTLAVTPGLWGEGQEGGEYFQGKSALTWKNTLVLVTLSPVAIAFSAGFTRGFPR